MIDLTAFKTLPMSIAVANYNTKVELIESLPLTDNERTDAKLKCAQECIERVEAALKATLSESVKDTCHPDQ